jgi:hypothetical protein
MVSNHIHISVCLTQSGAIHSGKWYTLKVRIVEILVAISGVKKLTWSSIFIRKATYKIFSGFDS